MKKTIKILNELVERDVIKEYAIAGGMAQFYYVEPSVTYDLDLIVNLNVTDNPLTPLSGLYKWADENNLKTEGEHIIIGGIPVQFLLAYNELIAEALLNKEKITLFEESSFILSAEYLMAIMLQTGRAVDYERLIRFFNEADYDENKFSDIIDRFGLRDKYADYKKRING
ncbi:MAG TPA: hypothetical protein PL018_15250 [Ignavibacteriaceae bacterium]|nr:hypothetical protein [Ignavibacteriaceae bacterium]